MRFHAVLLVLGLLALDLAPTSAQDVTGTWIMAVDLGAGGGGEATFVLEQDGSELSGTYSGAYGRDVEVSGTSEGGHVEFAFVAGTIGRITYDGTLDGDTMSGDVRYGGAASGTFEGSRAVFVTPLWSDELISRIDELAESTIEGGSVAAMSIGVQRAGEPLLMKGYGLADIENDVPATEETVYRIGSITKQFTAASIMQLVEAGQIGLDDPMTRYLPDYPTQGHEVTIRHLLTHTSGIVPYTGMEGWRPLMTLDLTDEELVDLFKDEPFNFEPGERYQYNNSGYYLLGMIVAAASGESYREYLDGHLFGPLGLAGSTYCDERPIIPNRAEGYQYVRGELFNDDPLSMNQPGAAGALCSTVPDLLRWSVALREGEVVSRASYEQMTTPGTLNDGSDTGYGFGLQMGSLIGRADVAHGGGINGFNTYLAYYPDADVDVVVLSNTPGAHVSRVSQAIAMWALGIEVEHVLDEPIQFEEIAAYEGTYELAPGFQLSVFSQGGQLWTQATGQGAVRLRSQGDGRFVPTFDDRVWIEFVVEDGRATTLILNQGGRREAPRVE